MSHHQHYRDHHIISSSLSFPKLWLSRFLIFLYLAKVPPPSFFSRSTTPVPGNGISPGLPDHDDEEEDDEDNNEQMDMATNLLKRTTAPGNGVSPSLPSDGDEVDVGDVQIGIGENIAMQV